MVKKCFHGFRQTTCLSAEGKKDSQLYCVCSAARSDVRSRHATFIDSFSPRSCCPSATLLQNFVKLNLRKPEQEPSGRNVQRVKLFLPFSSKCNLGWSWIVIFRGRNDDVIFLFSGAATQRRTRPYPKEGIHQILPNENKKFTLHRVVCFFYQNKSDSQIKPQCY